MGSNVMLFSPEGHVMSQYYVIDETTGFILEGKDANDGIFLSVDEEGNHIRVLEAGEVKWGDALNKKGSVNYALCWCFGFEWVYSSNARLHPLTFKNQCADILSLRRLER